jgi:hypothetical protein
MNAHAPTIGSNGTHHIAAMKPHLNSSFSVWTGCR